MSEFRVPKTMTPSELGDSLARLVWESFTDFIAEGEQDALLGELELADEMGDPDERVTEEMLIFLMWAHTRAAQLAFHERAPEDLVRQGLDALHRAIFEDMVENGTPRSHLPLFEQRVAARYSEYYAAADESDTKVGETALGNMKGRGDVSDSRLLSLALTERALVVANPLRDFLREVELVEA